MNYDLADEKKHLFHTKIGIVNRDRPPNVSDSFSGPILILETVHYT